MGTAATDSRDGLREKRQPKNLLLCPVRNPLPNMSDGYRVEHAGWWHSGSGRCGRFQLVSQIAVVWQHRSHPQNHRILDTRYTDQCVKARGFAAQVQAGWQNSAGRAGMTLRTLRPEHDGLDLRQRGANDVRRRNCKERLVITTSETITDSNRSEDSKEKTGNILNKIKQAEAPSKQ